MSASYLCGVIGNPIAHSRSPEIHQWFARQFDLAIQYERILSESGNFEANVKSFFERGGRGLNITTPFKEQAFTLAHVKYTPAVQAQSGNTLWLEDDQFHVTSTDGAGWYQHVQHLGLELQGKSVLILGAGGAGRVLLEYLRESQEPGKIVITNRSPERLATIQQDTLVQCVTLSDLQSSAYDLIINALPTGWHGSFPDLDLSVNQSTLAYDLNYAEGATVFRNWFIAQGGQETQFHDGWGMLVCQAALSFNIWWQQQPETTALINDPSLIS